MTSNDGISGGSILQNSSKQEQFWNPYLAGVILGLVLLASFIIAGRGLGASGITSQVLVQGAELIHQESEYLDLQKNSKSLFESWIFVEVLGIFIGAFLSARLSKRQKLVMIKGKGISNTRRIIMALIGGALMGFAARLARGCTSGQALSGGALLSAGSWIFMLFVFIGAYLAIVLFKRDWQ